MPKPTSTTKKHGGKDPTAVSRLVLEKLDKRTPKNNIVWGQWLVHTKENRSPYYDEVIEDILDAYSR